MTDIDTITCRINGQDKTLSKGTSLIAFLESRNVSIPGVVVEYNREVLPKGQYEGIILNDGDVLEIIQVIGGG